MAEAERRITSGWERWKRHGGEEEEEEEQEEEEEGRKRG